MTNPSQSQRTPEATARMLRSVQRKDFLTFLEKCVGITNPGRKFRRGWHHRAIAKALQTIEDGKPHRHIFTMPPRSLKSMTISVAWVAFILGRFPDMKVMCVSYSEELTVKFARDCAKIMRSDWFKVLFPDCKLIRETKEWLETSQGGGRYSVTVGGQITGLGADVIILDDPIKPQDAQSEGQRIANMDWFRTTLASRLDEKATGVIVLVMQRLHVDDLAGQLLQNPIWTHTNLPAIAQEDMKIDIGAKESHVFRAGEALHPERESLEVLARVRAEVGGDTFAAQYLQEPVASAGAMLKPTWFATSPANMTVSPGDYIVQSWDCASKPGVMNDYSVCITAKVVRGEVHILHVMREKLEFPALRRKVEALAQEYHAKLILIEDAASGQQLIQTLNSELASGALKGVPYPIAIKPTQDKRTRMAGATSTMEAGKLLLPADAPWRAAFLKELMAFPFGLHDDQADALSQLLIRLRESPPIPAVLPGVNYKAPNPWTGQATSYGSDPDFDPDDPNLSRDFHPPWEPMS